MKQLCVIRNFPVIMHPEEYVRQQLLQNLMQYVPKSFIHVERPIKDYGQTDALYRADIVILDKVEQPFIVIECKEPSVMLTLDVKEQAIGYNDIIKAPYISITNGDQTRIYEQTQEGYKLISLTDITTLLDNQKYEYVPDERIDRLTFEESQHDEYIDELIEAGNVSFVSQYKKQSVYAELHNALLTEPYVPTNRDLPVRIIKDLGYGLYSFQNASGKEGCFDYIHRSFLVDDGKDIYPYRMVIVSAGKTKNHGKYGNRKGSTGWNIGIQTERNKAYTLELNLDKYSEIIDSDLHIFHNGIMKIKGITKEIVVAAMQDFYPALVEDDKIIIGSLPINGSIREELSYCFENIILYCHVRSMVKTVFKSS